MTIARFLLACLVMALATATTGALEATDRVPTEPILRIEAGMHTAGISSIDADASGRLIVTGSHDKTVRLWDGQTGALIRTFRLPIGFEYDGAIDAVAISSDGRRIAAGGSILSGNGGLAICVFDATDGSLVQRLTDLPQVIYALAFSPDGSRLAAAMPLSDDGHNYGGLRVWSLPEGKLLKKDTRSPISELSWSAVGRLATFGSSIDLYDTNLVRLARMKAPTDATNIALSPDGKTLAIAYKNKPRVDLVSARDLKLQYRPETKGIDDRSVLSVAWSADGQVLYARSVVAAPFGLLSNESSALRRWDEGGRGSFRDIVLGDLNDRGDLKSIADGLLVATNDPAWARLDEWGNRKAGQSRVTFDMRPLIGDAFQIADDGGRVRFGIEKSEVPPLLFDLAKHSLTVSPHEVSGLKPAVLSAPGIEIVNWRASTDLRLNGRPIQTRPNEFIYSIAVIKKDEILVTGSIYGLRKYSADGVPVDPAWTTSVAMPLAVNASGDGRVIVAAYGDGTIRWHRTSDLATLLTLFVARDGKRWVAWTPSGYYMAGPGGEDLIGWHVNNGPDQAADFYPASRFRDRFNRPDIVERILQTQDEGKAVAEADAASRRKPVAEADMRATLPPIVDILSPAPGESFSDPHVTLSYRLRSPSGKPVTGLRLLVDGRPVATPRGLVRTEAAASADAATMAVDLPMRDVTIALVAESEDGAGPVASVALRWTGAAIADPTKPKLYALVVGTSAYDRQDLRLGYAAKDASDFGAALKAQSGGLYREVEVRVLADSTRDEVADGLDWLVKASTSRDVAMLFFSGHGLTDERGDFWYLPRDGDPDRLRRTAVPNRDITDALDRIPGKAVLFLDTCHSGAAGSGVQTRGIVDLSSVVNELSNADKGIVVYASSTGKQLSVEDQSWQNGVFTKALLEGFSGKADVDGNHAITLAELDLYLAERVKTLTGGNQQPVMRKPDAIPNIAIAVPEP